MSSDNQAQPVIAWHQVPNALSIARIVAAPLLVGLALTRGEVTYTWLLVAALASDIADGMIARSFHWQSAFGAKLDSVGDVLLLVAVLFGVWSFHPEVFYDHWPALALFLGAGLLEYVLALFRYGQLSSFHTWLSKVAGFLLVLFVVLLFVDGFVPWLLHLAIGLSVLASIEEYLLIAALPQWRANVRGIWWLWRERAEAQE